MGNTGMEAGGSGTCGSTTKLNGAGDTEALQAAHSGAKPNMGLLTPQKAAKSTLHPARCEEVTVR